MTTKPTKQRLLNPNPQPSAPIALNPGVLLTASPALRQEPDQLLDVQALVRMNAKEHLSPAQPMARPHNLVLRLKRDGEGQMVICSGGDKPEVAPRAFRRIEPRRPSSGHMGGEVSAPRILRAMLDKDGVIIGSAQKPPAEESRRGHGEDKKRKKRRDETQNVIEGKNFVGLNCYFCIFCAQTFSRVKKSDAVDHLLEHMKSNSFCRKCDSNLMRAEDTPCPGTHTLRTLDDSLIEWAHELIDSQTTMIEESSQYWFSEEHQERRVFWSGCCVCEKIILLCRVPNGLRRGIGIGENSNSSEFMKHCRTHLRYYSFFCRTCRGFKSYDETVLRHHMLSAHQLQEKNLFENKNQKLEQYLVWLLISREQKLHALSPNEDTLCPVFAFNEFSEATYPVPCRQDVRLNHHLHTNGSFFIRCLLCGERFLRRSQYRAHQRKYHPQEPQFRYTPTKEFYFNLFQIL